jgi:succinyldiaminopimelate transaminase
VAWSARRLGATVTEANVVPSIGSKELVSLLPVLLGLHGKQILLPALAYPTYDVGARLAGCEPVATDDPTAHDPAAVGLVWLNSPSNPTGRVQSAEELRQVVAWGREHGVLIASDECYLELDWEREPVSVLHPSVSGSSTEGVLALHSLSKRSNLAGYRAGFAVGDATAIALVIEARKHIGLLPPAPIQAATIAALGDDAHVAEQRERYRLRREQLKPAVEKAGFRVEHSEAGLYLWCTRDEDCWQSVGWLADRGILAAPGAFYGVAGARHVRVALTATDERVSAAADRLC